MKLIVKCQCCGREVEAKNPKKKYCGPLCAKQMQRKKYAAKTHERPKTNAAVTEIAKQAQAAGLSYGQYVARMYGKRG